VCRLVLGTPDNPECPLLPIFGDTIFPKVEALVGPGGKYESYKPVFQGDNAGPHVDAAYTMSEIKGHCKARDGIESLKLLKCHI
jgi:hypothetical protein